MNLSSSQLRNILVKGGFVSVADFQKAVKSSMELGTSLTDILIFRGIISEQSLGQLIAEYLKVPFINIGSQIIPLDVLQLVPEKMARIHQFVPFAVEDQTLKVALSDPTDFEAMEFLRRHTGLIIEPYYASLEDIRRSLGQYKRNIKVDFEKIISENVILATSKMESGQDRENEDIPIIKILNTILEYALAEGASDIHIEKLATEEVIRFRIDGVLRDILSLPTKFSDPLVARVKILANLKIDEHRIPQDGRYKYDMGGGEVVAFRVSIIPSYYGENIVLRLLQESSRPFSLEELGYFGKNLENIKSQISKPHGLILVTGPTGSGKTTSLYSILNMLNDVGVKMCTIEDPIEYGLSRLTQIQVNNQAGLTFAAGLRALLRHDPNIIMVGEIRDKETAEIAIHAALTGHLVLTTLHTNDAASAMPRMQDMGVEPYLLASTINLTIGQRLVRKICASCVVEQKPEIEVLHYLKKILGRDVSKQKFYKGKGCAECNNSGYKGRIGIYELLQSSSIIRRMVVKGVSADELKEQALKEGMLSMLDDGIDKVASGTTTLEEVLRAVRE